MQETINNSALDRLIDPLAACLTEDVAQRIVDIRFDSPLRQQMDEFGVPANGERDCPTELLNFASSAIAVLILQRIQQKAKTIVERSSTLPPNSVLDHSPDSSNLRTTSPIPTSITDSTSEDDRQAADIEWVRKRYQQGNLAQYAGQYIVVYRQAVVAHGAHPTALKKQAAEKLSVHTGQLILDYVEPSVASGG